MIFGEEWWWYAANVRPGDQISHERIFTGYKLTDTKFAGPSLFQRGDTIHRNQRRPLQPARFFSFGPAVRRHACRTSDAWTHGCLRILRSIASIRSRRVSGELGA